MLICPHSRLSASTISSRGLLADQFLYIPTVRLQLFAVAAGCGSRDFAVDDQIDAGGLGVLSAANEETDPGPLDGKRRRDELADFLVVAAQERIDEVLALETATFC